MTEEPSLEEFHAMIEALVESGRAFAFLEPDGDIRLIADIHCTEDARADAMSLEELRQRHLMERTAPFN